MPSNDTCVGSDGSRSLQGTFTEPNMFEVAGVRPMLGRTLHANDATAGAEPVVVLGHGIWTTSYGADPGVTPTVRRRSQVA